jgi:hypothetical protein
MALWDTEVTVGCKCVARAQCSGRATRTGGPRRHLFEQGEARYDVQVSARVQALAVEIEQRREGTRTRSAFPGKGLREHGQPADVGSK